MKLNIDSARLRAFLSAGGDCEALGENEFVADLYDFDTPATLDIVFGPKGEIECEAAQLLYDEEQAGWYMGERIEDAKTITAMLCAAMEG